MDFNWGKSIFPILGCSLSNDNQPTDVFFCGTSFFTIISDKPILISAKHVFDIFTDETRKPVITTRFGNNPNLKLSGDIHYCDSIDIAFMVLNPDFYEKFHNEFVPIKLSYKS